ncbi:MAG: hypothetical protein JO336_23480 [Acidobacteriia bacterium]|nr:hypothetical protein [Terriglobia bacterium]MBV8902682.1 hypothetical protein [Terriglobia bacterium]MBV9743255.1 hypothetical protein [Terriglobia bacterium]
MDVEKTMEFILEQLAQVATLQAKAEERQAKAQEQQAKLEVLQRRTDERLTRAIRLAVWEARQERKKRQELDDYITKLSAAQLVTEEKLDDAITKLSAAQLITEEKLQRFLEWRGGNGKV